jgi:hypothetical protein
LAEAKRRENEAAEVQRLAEAKRRENEAAEVQRLAEAKRKAKEVGEVQEKKQSIYAWDTPPKTETKKPDNGGKLVEQVNPAPGERVSRANYDKIMLGMSLGQVESILGPGKESASSVQIRVMNWSEGLRIISVTFTKGRVSVKVQVGL